MKKTTLLLFLIWGMTLNLLIAQDITGKWHGLLDIDVMKLRLDLDIAQQDGKYTTTLYSPDQTPEGIPVPEFKFQNGLLEFGVPDYTIAYSGTVDKAFTSIVGSFKQGGQEWPLNFSREALDAPPGSPEWIKSKLDKQEVYITMRDGVRLFTSIYTPKDASKKYPMLMTRTPYNIEPNGEDGITYHLMASEKLIEEGYIFVYQDVRGRYMSEGEFEDVRPINTNKKSKKDIDESTDTYDAIDWLVKNVASNNGRIGIFGVSYPGFYSTMSLVDAHPALKAVSPQAPVTNWFIGDDFHHNGAFALIDGFSFYSSFGKPRPKPTREGQAGFEFPGQDSYDFFLKMGALKHAKELVFGDSIRFWNDLMSHPNYDDFWKARDPRPHLKNIKPAVLTVGGHFDAEDCWGAWQTYQAIEKQNPGTISNRLMMGPWSHGQWTIDKGENMGNIYFDAKTGEHYKQAELAFFNFYLKDKGQLNMPEADIFITGQNKWHSFDTWPPKNVTEKTLYFQPNGGISMSAPAAKASFDEYVSDPMKPVPYTEDVHLQRTREYMNDDQRFAARRPDVMVYQTDILTEDVTLTGPLTADLFVSTTGTDADFVVKLIDVFPDTLRNYHKNDKQVPMAGYQMLVRGEIFRGRYRNSYEKPEAFVPGQVTQVKYELPDVAHTFKKGHRIMVQVQNSWFPLFDRNPQKFVDIYTCDDTDFQKANMRIYHEAGKASGVKVKVLN